jgi:predicted nuclease of predicted toxin-antitoxin system
LRWLADECVAAGLVERLRAAGEDVSYVAEVAPGMSDARVIALAQIEGRLLLTDDKDFGDIAFRKARQVPGIVLLRIGPERRSLQWAQLEPAIAEFGEGLYGRYTVIEESRFRSRPLRPKD